MAERPVEDISDIIFYSRSFLLPPSSMQPNVALDDSGHGRINMGSSAGRVFSRHFPALITEQFSCRQLFE
jgi:hypothetical protein